MVPATIKILLEALSLFENVILFLLLSDQLFTFLDYLFL